MPNCSPQSFKLSLNQSINELWEATSKTIQFDAYNTTKQVLKDFRSRQDDKLHNQLTCQSSFFYQHHKVRLFPTHQNLVCVQIESPKKHIQLYSTIYEQLPSNPLEPYKMEFITNLRLF